MVSSGEQGEGGEVIVTVNVGGVRQLLPSELLCRFPETRLGRLCLLRCSPGAPVLGAAPELALDLCDDFDPRSGEFYFDRDPRSFDAVLDLYYVGEIHMERGVCPICFKNEMDFWQVDVDYLDDCCRGLFSEKLEELEEVARRVRLVLDDQAGAGEGDHWKRFQKTLWKLMEKPETSAQARTLAIASFLVVVVSAVTMCLGTIPELQVKSETGQLVEHPTVTIIETVCIVWFTLEYVLRLISAPQTLHFVFSFMNIIDMLAILPYYLAMLLSGMGDAILELNNVQQAVQALRIMRIVRVFKLARHSSGLQTLTYALKSSFKELSLLLLYLAMGIFLFSALGYTLEQSHPETMFTSIPHSFWWAIITMTTVGYGDIFPKTGLGKLNAAASFLCGILAIALPIHPIINNFVKYYNKQKVLDTAVKHQLERLATGALHAWHGASVPTVAAETRPQECTFRDSGAGLKRHVS